MTEAVIFDMDGVIIDSEPFWEEAEIELFNKYGVPMTLEMCQDMKGRKIDEVVQLMHERYHFSGISVKDLTAEVIAKMQELIALRGEAMEGLHELLDYLKLKNYHIALASSSKMELIVAVTQKLKIKQYFEAMHSAEHEPAGKPEPYVYLSTAKALNIAPEKCIAIEDSYLGLQSAKNAGMKTIAIPEKNIFEDEKFSIADYKIKNLKEIIDLGIL
ncbi:MAG: hexitol phosphatase HxpB [Bacteroidales bacterium]|nr:hexitol phosphatase HxpB [Bacteroidales bacterium]